MAHRFKRVLTDLKKRGRIKAFNVIASDAKVSPQTITEVNGGRMRPPDEVLQVLKKKYSVNTEFITENKGSMYVNGEGEIQEDAVGSDIMLPMRGQPFSVGANEMEDLGNGLYRLRTLLVDKKSAAGYLTGWGDQEYLGELKHHSVIVRNPARGIYRSFQIHDNNESMYNENDARSIGPRDIVTGRLLNRSMWKSRLHFNRWPFWVIVHKTEGITTKQIIDHQVDSGIIMCHSLNPDKEKFSDFPLFLDDVIQLFNVIKVEHEI